MNTIRLLAAISLLPVGALAQCAVQWTNLLGLPGTSGTVQATTMWDPDGTGPAVPLLVVGGTMNTAGAAAVNYVATYDGATRTWAALGNPGYHVQALAVLPSGDLVAGGRFNNVVRWNGTAWVALGGAHNGIVRALAVGAGGQLYAGGEFAQWGGVPASNVAAWNGSAWVVLGAGVGGGKLSDRGVHALAVMPGGDLVAGGYFTQAGTFATEGIARWDGTAWSTLGTGVGGGTFGSFVRALLPIGGGVLAAGSFSLAGGAPAGNVALWNGAAWVPFGSLGVHVYALRQMQNGRIVAAGSFGSGLATWSGTAWTMVPGLPVVPGPPSILATTELPSGELALGGSGVPPFHGLMFWNGTVFSAPNDGIGMPTSSNSDVMAAASLSSSGVILGGSFTGIAGTAANNVVRFDGVAWHALGAGTGGAVMAALALPGGDVVVGGSFATAGGVPANNIARWNGTAWSSLGSGTDAEVRALGLLPDGRLVAAGAFMLAGGVPAARVAVWNGSVWSPLGTGLPGTPWTLAVLGNGDVAAGGRWPVTGTGMSSTSLLRWNGAAWASMGTFSVPSPPPPFPPSTPDITCLRVLANGDLLAGGSFTTVAGMPMARFARWNGATWTGLGPGPSTGPATMHELPDGDILVGGGGLGGPLARWDGSAWSSMGGGSNHGVAAIAPLASGQLVLGGSIGVINTASSGLIAVLVSTCPAAANATGNGCLGTTGLVSLAATSLPWTGGRFAARSTGLPAGALAIALTGFGALAQPIAQITPLGGAGCDVLVTPDAWVLLLSVAGAAEYELPVPDSPVLAGLVLRHQHLVLERHALGYVNAITSTNALQLTVGTF